MHTALLPVGLAFLMLVAGLAVRIRELGRCWQEPRALLVGLACQILLLPVLAVLILSQAPLSSVHAAGLLLIAASPGGITSTFLTLLGGGDVPLAATISTLSNLATALSLPLVLAIAAAVSGLDVPALQLPLDRLAAGLVVVGVLPLAAGIVVRAMRPSAADQLLRRLQPVGLAVFAAIVVYTFAAERQVIANEGAALVPAVLALNLGALATAYIVARLFRLGRPQTVSIVFECGLQNAAVAIVAATSLVTVPGLAAPALIYSVTMNVTILAILGVRWIIARGRIIRTGAPAALVVLLLTAPVCAAVAGELSASPIEKSAGLVDHRGQIFQPWPAGKIGIVYFGYLFCPDVCPTSLGVLAGILDRLGDDISKVSPVFVTVDPERDTVERLANYVALFHPAIIGVTGTTAEIDKLAARYRVVHERVPSTTSDPEHYTIDHTASLFVISPDGNVISKLPHRLEPEFMLRRIQEIVSKELAASK